MPTRVTHRTLLWGLSILVLLLVLVHAVEGWTEIATLVAETL